MIGIDTNVLIRYITQDDGEQARQADVFLSKLTDEHPGYVTLITIAELVWVLRTAYDAPRLRVLKVVETLLSIKKLRIEKADIVMHACRIYQSSNADFSDCLIERLNHAAGCTHTVTFDRAAAKSTGMRLL